MLTKKQKRKIIWKLLNPAKVFLVFALFLTLLCIGITKTDSNSEIIIIGFVGWLLFSVVFFMTMKSAKQIIKDEFSLHTNIVNKFWIESSRSADGDRRTKYYIECDYSKKLKVKNRNFKIGDTIIIIALNNEKIITYNSRDWNKLS